MMRSVHLHKHDMWTVPLTILLHCPTGHFTVVYLVAKPLIWSEAEGDLVEIETSIQLAW